MDVKELSLLKVKVPVPYLESFSLDFKVSISVTTPSYKSMNSQDPRSLDDVQEDRKRKEKIIKINFAGLYCCVTNFINYTQI